MPDPKRAAESYARLYDDILDNSKIATLRPAEFGLFCAMISWSHRNDSDGAVPLSRLHGLLDWSTKEAYAKALLALSKAELIEIKTGLYAKVHDYELHNETHAERNARRIAARNAAGIRWGNAERNAESMPRIKEKVKEKENDVSKELTSSDASDLCQKLELSLHAWGAKGHTTEAWMTAADRLLRLDKRPLDEAIQVLEWATQSEFWRPNIMSMPTFREKYDTLRGQMMRDVVTPAAPVQPIFEAQTFPDLTPQQAAVAQDQAARLKEQVAQLAKRRSLNG